jgi:hypothetical protein
MQHRESTEFDAIEAQGIARQADFRKAKDAEFHPNSRVPRHCIRI